jgi:hypothetical protein
MPSDSNKARAWLAAAATVMVVGCSKEEGTPPTPTPPSAHPAPAAPAPVAPVPSATASAPAHDCPKDTSGDGTFAKPCLAKGAARTMEVGWTGKMDEKGPSFRVINKSPSTILYGRIAVYFYDKAGKQLDVTAAGTTPPKTKPYHICTGNMFGGVMKPAEKAVITFSCVTKENVPEGAKTIEAEMQMVGFTDPTEKGVEYYWRNDDLVPEVRKKGGVK